MGQGPKPPRSPFKEATANRAYSSIPSSAAELAQDNLEMTGGRTVWPGRPVPGRKGASTDFGPRADIKPAVRKHTTRAVRRRVGGR